MIQIKKLTDEMEEKDGFRILIDNFLPSNFKSSVDCWYKDLAPSKELIEWFSEDISKWDEFQNKYLLELGYKEDLIKQIKFLEKVKKKITLVSNYSDQKHNPALILKEYLDGKTHIISIPVGRTHGA